MNILITGAAGFVGKNLTAALECIRDGRDKTHPGLTVGELYLYDIDSDRRCWKRPAGRRTSCSILPASTARRIRKSSCREISALLPRCWTR